MDLNRATPYTQSGVSHHPATFDDDGESESYPVQIDRASIGEPPESRAVNLRQMLMVVNGGRRGL